MALRLDVGEMGGQGVSCDWGPALTTLGSNCWRKEDLEREREAERGTDRARLGDVDGRRALGEGMEITFSIDQIGRAHV